MGIVGDVREFIQDLLNLLKKEGDFDREQVQSWRNSLNRWRDEYPLLVPRNARIFLHKKLSHKLVVTLRMLISLRMWDNIKCGLLNLLKQAKEDG